MMQEDDLLQAVIELFDELDAADVPDIPRIGNAILNTLNPQVLKALLFQNEINVLDILASILVPESDDYSHEQVLPYF